MEQSTEFFFRERTSKRHSVASAPERSAMRISLDLHLKRPRRSSTSQHGRTFSKGHTDSGPEAELIRTSSLHKLSRGVQLSSCFWQSPERWQKRQFSPSPPAPAPSLAVGKWHQQCALSDTSLPTQLGPSLVLGWSSCQAGALMIQLTQSCWSWHKGRESSGSVEPGAEKAAVLGWWQPVMKRDSKLRPWQPVYLNELFHSWLWHSLITKTLFLYQRWFLATSVPHFGRWHMQAALTGITPWSCVSLWWKRGALSTLMHFKSKLSVCCGSDISQLLFGRDRAVQPWLLTAMSSVWAKAGLTCAAKWRQCFVHKSQLWWIIKRKSSQCRHHYWDTWKRGPFGKASIWGLLLVSTTD